jgi:N-acetylglucosamine-6-sulfatase
MHPLIFRVFLSCLLVFSWLSVDAASDGAEAESRPNIILILTDDHRHDALGFAGHPFLETPNLDRLAAEGAHFRNAYVTTSLCSPSRASILTGLYAHNHQVVDNYHPVREDLVFFPQLLQKAGYETAFIGKWHMGDTDEKQRGFDHWVSFRGQGIYWPHAGGLEVKGRYVPQAYNTGFNVNGRRIPQKGYITDELTTFATGWIAEQLQQDSGRPFFLYLSHKAAHADFLPPNRHAFKYENEPVEVPGSWADTPEKFTDVPLWVRNQRNSRHGVEFAYYSDLDLKTYYRRYCETLLAVDDSVGAILDLLESTGVDGDTIVLYMGDNGFLFGEHGVIDKRCSYEESIRIPMIARAPGIIPAGQSISAIVANIDVAPTLLQVAGVSVPDQMDGRSFAPFLKGRQPQEPWRGFLLYEYYWERNYPQTPTMHAVFNDRIKYTRYHGIWDIDELYDLRNDPHERNNLIHHPEWQDQINSLNARLFGMLEESNGMSMPLMEDRGTKFFHRRRGGSTGAAFPQWFYREAGDSGR